MYQGQLNQVIWAINLSHRNVGGGSYRLDSSKHCYHLEAYYLFTLFSHTQVSLKNIYGKLRYI